MKCDADIIGESREYIAKNGWWRGRVVGPNGRQVCGMGAVIFSQGWNTDKTGNSVVPEHSADLYRVLGKVLKAANWVSACGSDFVHWNDSEAKNKQEVLDAFAKAEKIELAGFDPDA